MAFAALLYHDVGEVIHEVCRGLTVQGANFVRQMKALRALGYQSVLPSQLSAGTGLLRRSLLITFDDAYSSITSLALPVLDEAGFKAVIYTPTSFIGRSMPCRAKDGSQRLPVMDEEAIRLWSSRGFEFGAHTRTHADLTMLTSKEIEAEVRGSRDDLEALLNSEVTTFAYPYGRVDERSRGIVGAVYSTAFTIQEGVNDDTTPPFLLRRTMVQHGDSTADVILRARYGKSVLGRVRKEIVRMLR